MVLIAVILLLIGGVGSKNLKPKYYPHAEDAYKLGLALNQITQPNDLVVTIAQDIGDPVAIYYSQRRGWVFPPVTNWSPLLNTWWDGIKNDREAIQLLEELREQGAGWLGIVKDKKDKIWKENPKLVEYIARTFELYQESPDWIIYRIRAQK
jgi:hypothetical protein